MLRRGDIISAYGQASLQHAEVLAGIERMKVETGPDIKFVEFHVSPASRCANKRVMDLSLPKGSILVSIRHGGRVLIPHGDTVVKPGDRVVALTRRADEQELLKALNR